jgi:LDH2 family malate/lactate/ureidoglycolate dehydrogenase
MGGEFLVEINGAHLMPPDVFKTRVDHYVRSITNSRIVPGVDGIFLTGERSLLKEEQATINGMEFLDEAWEKLVENTIKLDVHVDEPSG